MSTKGKSNLYGRGKRGKADSKIGYRYATHLTNKNEGVHINRHGMQEMQLTKSQYRSRAAAFANKVDIVNHVSFVRKNGLTYKYSLRTGEYAIITKEGIVTTYFRIGNKRWEEVKKQYDN